MPNWYDMNSRHKLRYTFWARAFRVLERTELPDLSYVPCQGT